jgi:hypothetical protein
MTKKNKVPKFIRHENSPTLKANSLLDRFGFLMSFLCLIHCIAVPLLLFILPSYSMLLGSWHENIHFIFI